VEEGRGVDPAAAQYFGTGAPPIIKLQHVLPCQSVIKIMKCLYCLNCHKFGRLIIIKIIRIILGVKNVQNSISAWAPDPIWGAYSTPLLVELTALP